MQRKNIPQKILVLGGSGFVGRHVCARLSMQLHEVTVPTRRLPARHIQMLPGVSVVQADVHDPQQLQALVRGHDAVINLVAILHGNEEAFTQAHVTLPTQLARACHAENVSRLIHVSALGAELNAPSMYQRSKARGEAALLSAAEKAPLGLTLLRPSVIFGKDDQFINLFAKLQNIFPFMPLAGANTKFQPVWVQDVAQALVHALVSPASHGQRFELVGPEVFTLAQLVQHAGQWAGHPRPIWPLPPALALAQAWLMEHLPGPPLMSRDNLASMRVDNVSTGTCPGLTELGVAQSSRLSSVFPIPQPHHS